MDLDRGADWVPISEPAEVFSLDFAQPQAVLAYALCEKDLCFALQLDGRMRCPAERISAGCTGSIQDVEPPRCNAIVWWFEADVGGCSPVLSSAPSAFRPHESRATHWAQAVAGVGPWLLQGSEEFLWVRVRTDG